MSTDKRTKTTLRDRVLEHFAVLGIPITAEELDQILAAAEREGLSHLEAFDRALGEQAARRRERSIERRITMAHFPEQKTLEAFDWNFNKTIDRVQIEQLATGEFVRRRANLIMVGQSGVGKSHLAQALGVRLCAEGYRVFYSTSSHLLTKLTASRADKTLAASLRRYSLWDLLLIDEFGFDRIEREECPQAAHLLYKVIAARHQKRSTVVVTNLDFDKWAEYLGDAPLAMALLDRLVDGAITIKIKGPSYRAHRQGKASSDHR